MRKYYSLYNAGDMKGMTEVFEPDAVYEDLVYQDPFVGRDDIIEYLSHVNDEIGPIGLKF